MNPSRSYTLLTCSGVSNTGRLTTQVASVLVRRDPDRFECHLTAKQATRDLCMYWMGRIAWLSLTDVRTSVPQKSREAPESNRIFTSSPQSTGLRKMVWQTFSSRRSSS
jgi:hypothetical protein